MNNLHAWSIPKAHLVISTLASRLDTHTHEYQLPRGSNRAHERAWMDYPSSPWSICNFNTKKGAYLTTELTVEMGFLTKNLISGWLLKKAFSFFWNSILLSEIRLAPFIIRARNCLFFFWCLQECIFSVNGTKCICFKCTTPIFDLQQHRDREKIDRARLSSVNWNQACRFSWHTGTSYSEILEIKDWFLHKWILAPFKQIYFVPRISSNSITKSGGGHSKNKIRIETI